MSTLIFPTRDPSAFSALKQQQRSSSATNSNSNIALGRQRSEGISSAGSHHNGTKTVRLSLAGLGTRPVTTPALTTTTATQDTSTSSTLKEVIGAFPAVLADKSSGVAPSYERLYALTRQLLTDHHASSTTADEVANTLLDAYQRAITDRATASSRELRAVAMSLRPTKGDASQNDGGAQKSGVAAFLSAVLDDFARFEHSINRLGGVLLYLEAHLTTARMNAPNVIARPAPTDIHHVSSEGEQAKVSSLRNRAWKIYRQVVLENDGVVKDRAEVDMINWTRQARGCELVNSGKTSLDQEKQKQVMESNTDADESVVKRFIDLSLLLTFNVQDAGHPSATSVNFGIGDVPVLRAYVRETKQFYTEAVQDVAGPALALQEQDYGNLDGNSLSPTTLGPASVFVRWLDASYASERARALRLFSGGPTLSGHLVESIADRAWRAVKPELDATLSSDDYLLRLAQPALVEAMARSDAQTLRRLYLALINVRKFSEFKRLFSEHVAARCKALIGDPANDAKMVGDLLAFKRFCEHSIDLLYAHEEDISSDRTADGTQLSPVEQRRRLALEGEMRDGIRAGVETRKAVPAEMIAKHLDAVLRRGQGAASAAEFDAQLDEIVALVKFTKDKDVFKQFYVAQLAKRLLLGKSASNEEEMSMVRKLQREYGEEFTTGDAMMKDLTQSEEMNKKFAEVRSKNGKPPSELSVYVLSQGQWPPYTALGKGWEKFSLPPPMQKSLDEFAAWYGHTFSGRVLTWRHQHTSVTLTARFPGGNKEIGVSLFQAIVLMQFNEADSLTYEEIYDRTGIERSELVRTLQSLYALKATRMLVKRPPGKEVDPTDQFLWHRTFTRDRIKFKINQLQQDLSAEESRQTSAKVFEDRTLTLDAQIVRVMKGKKQLRLAELVNEVVDAVKNMFQPEVKAIKTQVESLIEREYLERDEEDRNMLKYLA